MVERLKNLVVLAFFSIGLLRRSSGTKAGEIGLRSPLR